MSAAPAVSVVTTVFNTERYVGEAVDSILAQTFSDFEYIVVDDGSSDRSAEVVEQRAERDPRLRLMRVPHGGIVKAANAGIAAANGRYLARMDSDDVALPQRFERQVRYLEGHPECVLLGTRAILVDPYGVPVAETAPKLTHEEIDAELMTNRGGAAVLQPSAMMRTEAVRRVGGYRGTANVSEDHDLFLRLAEVGKVANLDEPLLKYRRHYDSVMHTQFRQREQVKEQIIRDACRRRGIEMPGDWTFEPWEPPHPAEQLRVWGWAALRAARPSVARRHAIGAIRHAPFSRDAWRLMYCALRGR